MTGNHRESRAGPLTLSAMSLPPEIFGEILAFLAPGALAEFSTCSVAFYALATKPLFSRVRLLSATATVAWLGAVERRPELLLHLRSFSWCVLATCFSNRFNP